MRIALLMPTASPWSRQIALRLAELGHAVHVIDFEEHPTTGVYVHNQDSFQEEDIAALRAAVTSTRLLRSRFHGGLRYVTAARQLARVYRDCRGEVLLSLYGGGLALLAYLSGARPYAVYAVGSDVLMSAGPRRWLGARCLAGASLVLANGGYLGEQTRRMAPRANVVRLLIGVDTERFAPPVTRPCPLRILCTRGFLPVYNNDGLVRGLAALGDEPGEFHVTFTSGGPLLEQVRRLADEALSPSMRRRVAFLGGVSDDQMLAHLQRAHVFVSLSQSDGTSISLLEALACGLFPVLSDIPPNREWVDPAANNGLLVPLGDARALAAALRRALGDADLRARAATFNRKLILDRADARKNTTILAGKLAGLAGQTRQPRGGEPC